MTITINEAIHRVEHITDVLVFDRDNEQAEWNQEIGWLNEVLDLLVRLQKLINEL